MGRNSKTKHQLGRIFQTYLNLRLSEGASQNQWSGMALKEK
jgi:hypothetical protein